MPAHCEFGLDLKTLAPIRIVELPPVENAWPPEFENWAIDAIARTNPAEVIGNRLSLRGAWLARNFAEGFARTIAPGAIAQPIAGQAVPAGQGAFGPFAQDPGPIIRQMARARAGANIAGAGVPGASPRFAAPVEMRGFAEAAAQFQGLVMEADPIEAPGQLMEGAGIRFDGIFAERFRPIDIGGLFQPGPAPGARCDPDDLPAAIPAGMACQFSGGYEDVVLPHRVMNAEKGDVFLSPGGSGVIGRLLRQVDPPQRYAHSGIFTRRRTEVAHATASEDWLTSQHSGGVWSPPFGNEPAPSDGFNPDALKYIWPGGIIQSVEQAVLGSNFRGPDGKDYHLDAFNPDSGFAEFNGVWEVIPTVLVKPHPLQDGPAVRARLEAIADAARGQCVTAEDLIQGRQSKVHYRFFCYTDATLLDPAPASAGWAAGTLPAVCSQFVWSSARRAGVEHFEGYLEPEDVVAGARRANDTPDGLYLYTAEERARAAEWLHGYYVDNVEAQLEEKTKSGLIAAVWDLFSDMADDVANQIVNTFALDYSDTTAKDSERWKDEPRDGLAVSPDDILRWDSPERGGLWGTATPMDYRPPYPDKRPVYTWRQTTGPGTLKGHVRFRDQPAAGADVRVGATPATADAAGDFTIVVDEGPYVVDVGLHIDGIGYVEAHSEVTVLFNQTVEETINLQEPPDVKRRLTIEAQGWLRDAENFGEDEVEAVGFLRALDVHPWHTHEEFAWSEGAGGEVFVETKVFADLNFDKSVTVRLEGSFWEGTGEERGDLEMTKTWVWTIPPDQQQIQHVLLWNEDEDEPGDHFDVTVVIRNDRQP